MNDWVSSIWTACIYEEIALNSCIRMCIEWIVYILHYICLATLLPRSLTTSAHLLTLSPIFFLMLIIWSGCNSVLPTLRCRHTLFSSTISTLCRISGLPLSQRMWPNLPDFKDTTFSVFFSHLLFWVLYVYNSVISLYLYNIMRRNDLYLNLYYSTRFFQMEGKVAI